jgi:hypothetical protein
VRGHHAVDVLLGFTFGGLTEVVVDARLEPFVGVLRESRLVVERAHPTVTEAVVSDGVLLLRERDSGLLFALPTILVEACGLRRSVRHGRVREVGDRGEARNLPVGREAVALERREELKPVVFTVARLEAVAKALGEGAKVVLEGRGFRVPSRPEGAVEVFELVQPR